MEAATPEELLDQRLSALSSAFCPGAPIDEETLFAGRQSQRRELIVAINQRGRHVVLFGERGVGKTSLGNILLRRLRERHGIAAVKVNCDSSDTYSSLWKKVFEEVDITVARRKAGFFNETEENVSTLASVAPEEIVPNDVRRLLANAGNELQLVVLLDEFDRLNPNDGATIADTIKALSDHAIPATLILVGVAENVNSLISEHESIERALVQLMMPRMSDDELGEIVDKGMERAGMTVDVASRDAIVQMSRGLPYYTHLLALDAGFVAAEQGRGAVHEDDIGTAIFRAVDKTQQSIKQSYYDATYSSRADTIFAPVLLGCAMSLTDDYGYFTASAVREPLSRLLQRDVNIPSYAHLLRQFSSTRGPILERRGSRRRFRFRFRNPLMQPFVIMKGLSDGLVKINDLLPPLQSDH